MIDYVLLHAGGYSFAVFNLADAALTVGVIAILIASIFIGSTSDEQDKE
ncbi:MAG: signal peptidase II [Hyphomicrobiales bacterium]